jgi:hypothetical protein
MVSPDGNTLNPIQHILIRYSIQAHLMFIITGERTMMLSISGGEKS